MPIHSSLAVRNLSKEEFDERDKIVMRCAYDTQNALGRLCDERVYENELARRLRAFGFREVHTQVPVIFTHETYSKDYRLDLVADDAIYEIKTVASLTSEHDAQFLHYAMLLSVNHGKLLNFRNARVEGRLRFNAIMTEARYRLSVDDLLWNPLDANCLVLMKYTRALLSDWGGFLDFRLYEDALIHYFGGNDNATSRRPLTYEERIIGTHRFCFHAKDSCFMVTGFAKSDDQISHVQRLLSLSDFKSMQWINFHHHIVQFRTLTR